MSRLTRFSVLVLWVIAFSVSCEDGDDRVDSTDNDEDGNGDDDSGADDDQIDDDQFEDDDNGDDDEDTEEQICEEKDIPIEKKDPRLMILQDISGSMVHDEEGNPLPPPTKWDQAKDALIKVLDKFDQEVDFGADSFPNDGNCGVLFPVLSDTLPENGQNIKTRLDTLNPAGNTPLYLGMKNFTKPDYAPIFTGLDAASYLLVVTDGSDTCGVNGLGLVPATPQQLTEITTRLLNEVMIKSMVIGFSQGTSGVSPAQLNAIAAAGGTEYDTYFDVSDQAELEAALEEIVVSLVSCVYQLGAVDDPDVDMSKVNFYFITLDANGNEVKELVGWDENCDKNKGWQWLDFDNLVVEFCKEACDRLQTGEVIRIVAEFGCNPIPIE